MKELTLMHAGAALFLAVAAVSCDTIFEESDVPCAEVPVLVDVPYMIASPTDVTPTKAMTSDEQALYDLKVFIFREDGSLKGYTHVTDGLVQNGARSTVPVSTTTGPSIICAVANSSTTIWSVQDTDWEHITLDGLRALTFKANADGVTNPSDGRFLMSGWMNSGNAVTIGTQGLTTDSEVRLRRVLSQLHMNFIAGTDAKGKAVKSLSLLKYEVHGVAKGGPLFYDGKSTAGTFQNISYSQLSTQTPNQIIGYYPENLQIAPAGASINSQKDREKNVYSNSGVKSFPNAPDNGMYVVATVQLETTDYVGQVAYTIHLGDFGTSLNDFRTERNCRYTYNITVNDANDFVADVTRDDDGRSEGVIFDKNSKNVYTVDSHYGEIVCQFTAGDIRTAMQASSSAELGYGLMFQLKTWRGDTGQLVMDANGTIFKDGSKLTDLATVTKTGRINGVDFQWMEFLQCSDGIYNASDTFDGGNPERWTESMNKIGSGGYYTLRTDQTIYSFPQLLKELSSWAATATDLSEKKTYTCFIRENYYYEAGVTWGQFVNTDPRTAYILDNVRKSADGMSLYGKLSFGISQYSIQTAYARDRSGQIIAVGFETIDETAGKYAYTYGTNKMATGTSNGGNDARMKFAYNAVYPNNGPEYDSDGNFSQVAFFKRWTYWNEVEKARQKIFNGEYSTINPIKACAIRNREFRAPGNLWAGKADSGEEYNGYASTWEMAWYLPPVEQYSALWVGEEAISKEARLYQKQTSSMGTYSEDSFTADKIAAMMHYWTYTNGLEVFWSEEGAAYGQYRGTNDVKYLRCARLLQSYGVKDVNGKGTSHGWGMDIDLQPVSYYSYDQSTKTVSFDNLDRNALRTVYQENELASHNERDEVNKPAAKFQIADAFVGKSGVVEAPSESNFSSTATTDADVVQKKVACQGTYSQGGDATGWRVPNQRELTVQSIIRAAGKIEFPMPQITGTELGYFCLTTYSNPSYRISYSMQEQNLRMLNPLNVKTYPGWIRCVRDMR